MKNRKVFYIILALITFLLIVLAASGGIQPSKNSFEAERQEDLQASGTFGSGESETMKDLEKFEFPYELEDGKLEVTSLFQSDVPNPDKGFEEAKNLAAIELVNKSNEYLLSADVILTLADGIQLKFRIEDVPAGKKVWAFDLENTEILAENKCVNIGCDAEFSETINDWSTGLQIETNSISVTITNLTDETVAASEAVFHCLMGDTYFGGLSYKYNMEKLLPKESKVLQVLECSLGEAEVVRIEP